MTATLSIGAPRADSGRSLEGRGADGEVGATGLFVRHSHEPPRVLKSTRDPSFESPLRP